MKRASLLGCVLGVAMLGLSLASWSSVPARVPTHWGLGGAPDQWSSRALGLLMMPGLIFAVSLLLPLSLLCGRRAEHLRRSESAIGTILLALAGVFTVMHVAMLQAFRTPGQRLSENLVVLGLGAAWVAMGNVLGKVQSNGLVGIRTPWTLGSEAVWHKTHRFAGFTFVGGGLLAMCACLLPSALKFAVGVSALVGGGLAPVVYSYYEARAEAARVH